MTREYGQHCGLAHALDLIGARWSLLIVRELLTGPKRFTDLEQGLPGIPTNMLTARLRELEEDGLVERTLLPRPSSAVVYGLTPYGFELEQPVICLGLWGAKSLGKPEPGAFFSRGSFAIALRAAFHGDAAANHDLLYEVRLGDQHLNVSVREGQVSFPDVPTGNPDVILEAAPEVFAELLGGYEDIDAARTSGRMRVEGPQREARHFFEMFRLPSQERASR